MKAILILEDGKQFEGQALGVKGERIGRVIFNTAVVGYQEMITDPANAGKILVLTYPLIGNYGCALKFNESKNVWVTGLVIKEISRIFSNWQAKSSFDAFLKKHNLLTLCAVDTRTLAVHLRIKGEMLGVISTTCFEAEELLAKIAAFRKNLNKSLLPQISTKKLVSLGKPKGKKIAVLDLGITNSLIAQLQNLGLSLLILPYNTRPEAILKLNPAGLIISSGPEEDSGLDAVAANVRLLLGKVPILGISTGHEVLVKALGAKVTKMKLGHHGVNYPMHNPASYQGQITVQNHSYAADIDALNKIRDLKITGYNLNDRSVEEMESKKLKLIGVQYSPVSPGFNEVNNVFKRFLKMMHK